MKKRIFSLQYKMMFLTLAVAVIPTMIVGIVAYMQSIKIVEEQVIKSNFNTVQQMANNMNDVFQSMDDLAIELWLDDDFMECLTASDEGNSGLAYEMLTAQQRVNHYTVFKEDIYSVYVKAYNGLVFDTMSARNQVSRELEEELVRLKGKYVLISDEIVNFDGTVQKVFSLLWVLKDPKNLAKDLAIVKINILEKDISNIYRSNLLSAGSETFVIDEDQQILSAVEGDKIGSRMEQEVHGSSEKAEYSVREINGERSLCTTVPLNQRKWKLVNIVPVKDLTKDSMTIQEVTVVAMVASVFFCTLVVLFFTMKVLHPLKQLGESMKRLENENFNTELPERGNDEVTLVCRNFNKMSRKLNELINEVYAYQIKQKEAELKVLHEQINPHFLYNTLNTIYWMCKMERASETALLVDSLSKLFRLSLNSGKSITTVEKEMEYLRYYIVIQKKRYEEMIRFEMEVSEDVLQCQTVKLTLQPLVENAIYHGIEKKGTRGRIVIRAYRSGDCMYFQVSDDGAGADVERLNALLYETGEANQGFALRNVHERIRLYYGEPYGLSFESSPGEGTTVTVVQPVEVGMV